MQIFTNKTQTRFFSTDNHVKNLQLIDINSVSDLLSKGVCSALVPLRFQYLKVDDLDELIATDHKKKDGSDAHEPDTFHFDFLRWMSFADIVEEAMTVGTFEEQKKFLGWLEANLPSDLSTKEPRQFFTPDDSELFISVDYKTETITVNPDASHDLEKQP